ncbi:MAG: hypothetical protein FWF35_03870 [Elusimicrobia bacterium]|nr:hypothetical protein [Elusimicrobiota bacterium]
MKKIFISLTVVIVLCSASFAHDFVNCKKVTSNGVCMDIPNPVIQVKDGKGRIIFESKCSVFDTDGQSCKKWEYLRDYTYKDDKLVRRGYGQFLQKEGYFQDYVAEDLVYNYRTSKQCAGAYSDGTCLPFGERFNTDVMLNIYFKNKDGKEDTRYCKESDVLPDGTCKAYGSSSMTAPKGGPEGWRICETFDSEGKSCIKYRLVQFDKRDALNNVSATLRCNPETISADGNSCTEYEMSWWDYAYESAAPKARATAYKSCPKGSKIKEDGSCENYKCNIYKYENNVQTSEESDCSVVEPLIKDYKSKLAGVKK